MLGRLRAALDQATERTAVVRIDACRHYRAFRYGGFGNNPYEDYILGLARGDDLDVLRARFASQLLECRPRSMGEAIDADIAPQVLWDYPWARAAQRPISPVARPEANPDIVCHYCEAGVLASHLHREFFWLERSFSAIREHGYRPRQHGFVTMLELVGEQSSSFIVLDGNHRISAMHALGIREVEVKVRRRRIVRSESSRWIAVRQHRYTLDDALKVFDRYFSPANPPLRRLNPARLLEDEPLLWQSSCRESI